MTNCGSRRPRVYPGARDNIAMGTEIDSINEFEDILCLDPTLSLDSGWVDMRHTDATAKKRD